MNQAYLADILQPHQKVVIFGDVKLDSTGLHFMNPEHEAMWSLVDRVEDVLPTILATPRWREDARDYAVVR